MRVRRPGMKWDWQHGLAGLRDDAPGHTSATQRRRCGGRRRDRRARAGFEIDHSEPPGSRVAISRAAGPDGARNTRGATSNTSRKAAAHRHTQRPGTTGVEGAGGTCRGAGGRRRGLAGLRDDAPSEARGADDSRAGRRPPAHTAAGPDSARNASGATDQAPTQHRGAGPQARAPSATTQTRTLRSRCVPCRSARAARRSRRSSRSPRLRRRAGPHR